MSNKQAITLVIGWIFWIGQSGGSFAAERGASAGHNTRGTELAQAKLLVAQRVTVERFLRA